MSERAFVCFDLFPGIRCTRFQPERNRAWLKSKAKVFNWTALNDSFNGRFFEDQWNERFLLPSLLPLTTTITFSFTFLSWALASRSLSFCACLPRFYFLSFLFQSIKIIWTSLSCVGRIFSIFLFFSPFPEPFVWIFNQLISRIFLGRTTSSRKVSSLFKAIRCTLSFHLVFDNWVGFAEN